MAKRRMSIARTPKSETEAIATIVVLGIFALTMAWSGVKETIESFYSELNGHAGTNEHLSTLGLASAVVLSVIPLIVIVLIVWLIDRWEREPLAAYAACLGWGGGVAIIVAGYGNRAWSEAVSHVVDGLGLGKAYVDGAGMFVGADAVDSFLKEIFTVAGGAGIVEEAAKGAGVLLIFWCARSYINGALDGAVYGMLVGAGFAFTENIVYLGRAEAFADVASTLGWESSTSLGAVFVMRGLAAPFVHPICTAVTGALIGVATTFRRPRLVVWPLAFVGYGGAAAIHATHNFSAIIGVASTVVTRIVVQLPMYAVAAGLIAALVSQQKNAVRSGLQLLVRDGVISADAAVAAMSVKRRAAVTQRVVDGAPKRSKERQKWEIEDFLNSLVRTAYARKMWEENGDSDGTTNPLSGRDAVRLRTANELYAGYLTDPA